MNAIFCFNKILLTYILFLKKTNQIKQIIKNSLAPFRRIIRSTLRQVIKSGIISFLSLNLVKTINFDMIFKFYNLVHTFCFITSP